MCIQTFSEERMLLSVISAHSPPRDGVCLGAVSAVKGSSAHGSLHTSESHSDQHALQGLVTRECVGYL